VSVVARHEEEVAPERRLASPPQVLRAKDSIIRLDHAPILIPPPGFAPRKTPSNFPGFEFFSFVREETLERLELPNKFVKGVARQDSGYAFLRESSAGQKTRSSMEKVTCSSQWLEGVRLQLQIRAGFLSMFCHRQSTFNFTFKIFNNLMCRDIYLLVED
jgi:hypothetical protein